MGLHNYIEKLRQKPVRQRQNIAYAVTIVGFLIFVAVWVISLQEMKSDAEKQEGQASESLNDLKKNFQTGKDSIEEMMQELPSQTGTAGNETSIETGGSASGDNAENSLPSLDGNLLSPEDGLDNLNNEENVQDDPSVQQLP